MGGRGQGPRVSARPRAPSEAKAEIPEIPEIPDHPEIPGAPRPLHIQASLTSDSA